MMDLTFTGRGLQVTDQIRETAEHKVAALGRIEPRAVQIDLEFISEHHPKPDGVKRVEAALRIPRKTFRAGAEADDVPTALDRVVEKLERQIRDHHGKRRSLHKATHTGGLESAQTQVPSSQVPSDDET
jgi:ribosomal subunit interface protein